MKLQKKNQTKQSNKKTPKANTSPSLCPQTPNILWRPEYLNLNKHRNLGTWKKSSGGKKKETNKTKTTNKKHNKKWQSCISTESLSFREKNNFFFYYLN